ncbi:MAG: OmpA family protein [Planctomycetes bacterium]|nr:OmpA family protein [Planctomycetota bacterium]
MALKRKKASPMEGAPLWMVTYGDMVTLLLTFFVMLLAMSEVKEDDRFLDFMQAIREAFGYSGGVQQAPLDEVEVPRNVNLTEMLLIPIRPEDFSQSPDAGPRGQHSTVTNIRPGAVYVAGGKVQFRELSVVLTPEQEAGLVDYAEVLRGYKTQIELRGHCSPRPVDGTRFADHFDLSYQRARAVARALVHMGIDPQRLVLIASGTNEPIAVDAYTEVEREQNDVVEIMQVDRRVDEFVP